jgi:hypothetical protein
MEGRVAWTSRTRRKKWWRRFSATAPSQRSVSCWPFSLGFITHWAANPIPWQTYHLIAVLPILVGIALQMRALAMLLDIKSLQRRIFERANRIFITGLVFTACGVGAAILLDFFDIAVKSALPGA